MNGGKKPQVFLSGNFIEAIERFLNDGLDALDLIALQWRKFPFAPLFRKRTFILPDEKEEIVSNAVRHFNRIHDLSPHFVVAAQIVVQSKYRYRSAVSFRTSTLQSRRGRKSIFFVEFHA
ncbi:hypothetical protein MPC4_160089 [Methylocella tundrae]|uniref:Uncharacterized protein n=1 Tax=Methylocella tundrae TaxID=227605 RepID=A0A8B6M506_METTU|nr:hypothetical protein MPC1_1820002 [Methylocella tundrae]VTZ49439.1 hypothetical protein MPC4_160089 [Methylocella tundrae]